jgi:hypothetical protein
MGGGALEEGLYPQNRDVAQARSVLANDLLRVAVIFLS